jgi:hypothetical protein
MSKKNEGIPQLKIEEKDDDVKYIETLEEKLKEVQDLFDTHMQVLHQINDKRTQLNNEEQTVQFELSGLHGAITVINQLIEEAKDSKDI